MKRNQLIDLPVIESDSADQVGTIENLVIDFDTSSVVALTVNVGALGTRILLPKDAKTKGVDSIIIQKQDLLSEFSDTKCKGIEERITEPAAFSKIEVLTEDGERIGTIRDASITDDWKIETYIIHRGLVDSAIHGYGHLSPEDVDTIHPDRFIVNQKVGEALKESKGGIKGNYEKAKDAAIVAVNAVQDRIPEDSDDAQDIVKETVEDAKDTLSQGSKDSVDETMENHTKQELYEQAQKEDIAGRSSMSKQDLAEAVEQQPEKDS